MGFVIVGDRVFYNSYAEGYVRLVQCRICNDTGHVLASPYPLEACDCRQGEAVRESSGCPFFRQFGVHAYMGGRSGGKPELVHMEDWTTCCDADTPERAA